MLMLVYIPKLAAILLSALALYIVGRLLWKRSLHTATEEQIVNASKQQSHFF